MGQGGWAKYMEYNKNDKDMKKTYIAPSVEEIKVSAVNMLATSVLSISNDTVDTSGDGVQLGREDNTPSSPNLWEQGW